MESLLLLGLLVFHQSEAPSPSPEIPEIEAQPLAGAGDAQFKAERDALLNTLKTEVEPNLIKGDIQKLNSNVMRLGSYRRDWVEAAILLLVANAPVAELYLYRYSTLKNERLNLAALEALNRFPSFRFPRAVLAFGEFLTVNTKANKLYLDLLDKVVLQDASLAEEALTVASRVSVPVESQLYFMTKACAPLSKATGFKAQATNWMQAATSFWGKVLSDEVTACMKGLS